jgi:S-adenosylmethionine:tRNA ribosyltransferase-isomerase
MRLEELDLDVPEALIAQHPAEPRDSCRLLHLTAEGDRRHTVFSALPDLLRPGDTLVLNDSRVLPARLEARRPTGGKVELLLLRPASQNATGELWEALARPSHRLRAGERLGLGEEEELVLVDRLDGGRWVIAGLPGRSLVALMEQHGRLPLPPYIRTYPAQPSSYQTVYAATPGSAAAPTAGLHFTPDLLRRLEEAGIDAAYVTLHVGLDTFLPIREPVVERHKIHREAFSVSTEALRTIQCARVSGRRLVAVGTSATRVLETLAAQGLLEEGWRSRPVEGSTDIYITPGYRFRAVDTLITNFHLPRSTVMALTMAFVGVERLREVYAEAVAMGYRFFSFGDAMLVDAPVAAREAADARI